MGMNAREIELHIEELVLDGFESADQHHIADAVQGELARLLAQPGGSSPLLQGGEVALADGGSFHVAPNARAEAVGAQVAQSIYGGLNR